MAESVTVRALGVTVAMEVPDGCADEVRRSWSRALTDGEPDASVVLPEWYAGAPSHLSSLVTTTAIDRQAGRLWMLHGAALADPASGRTVALVGRSGTGKSTAARTLGHRFGYVSDETVAITLDGGVLPHPKPVSVIEGGTYPKAQRSPDELGLLAAPDRLTLAAIVLLVRDGSAAPVVTPVRTAAALPLLAEHTSYLTRFERPLHTMLGLLSGVPVLQVRYADAAALEPVVAGLVTGA